MRNRFTLTQEEAIKVATSRDIDFAKNTYESLIIIRRTDRLDRPCLTVFKGKSAKAIANFYYRSYDDRERAIAKWKVMADAEKESKEARKLEKKNAGTPQSKIGTIFVSSWGYDQTNIDYYQIIERPSAHYAIVKPIGASQVEGSQGMDCCRLLPVKDSFIEGKKEMRVKLNRQPSGDEYFSINSFSSAYVHDGTEDYCSWYA